MKETRRNYEKVIKKNERVNKLGNKNGSTQDKNTKACSLKNL